MEAEGVATSTSIDARGSGSSRPEREPEDVLDLWMRLARAALIGPRRALELLERLRDPETIFALAAEELEARGIPPPIAASLADPRLATRARAELELAREHGIAVVTRDDDRYPALLSEIHDPPVVLEAIGQLARDETAVAIVGSRRASAEGRRFAKALARDLVEDAGLTIVSGLARGIDAAAHEGALEASGRTIAVLGSGLLAIYPREHEPLAKAIASGGGAVVSEFAPNIEARPWQFPQRNRIVSGLARAVVVVEAGEKSGALITAMHAGEQGRDVLAVPGAPSSLNARGANGLIRDGAALVEHADDVIDVLARKSRLPDRRAREGPRDGDPPLDGVPRDALAALEAARGPLTVDDLMAALARPAFEILAALGKLEARGAIVRRLDGSVARRGG